MRLEWKRDQPVEVDSAAELSAALGNIEHDPDRPGPVLAFLRGGDGFLSIGVGNPEASILLYGQRDGQTPLHAVGDEQARASGEIRPFLTFFSYGHPYDFAKWLTVSNHIARNVARRYLESGGKLWGGIRWEEEKESRLAK